MKQTEPAGTVTLYCVLRDSPDIADGYEVLVRPDGTEVATITEPEDRTFNRDLRHVVDELNALTATIAALTVERDAGFERLTRLVEDRTMEAAKAKADLDAALAVLRVARGYVDEWKHGPAPHILSRIDAALAIDGRKGAS